MNDLAAYCVNTVLYTWKPPVDRRIIWWCHKTSLKTGFSYFKTSLKIYVEIYFSVFGLPWNLYPTGASRISKAWAPYSWEAFRIRLSSLRRVPTSALPQFQYSLAFYYVWSITTKHGIVELWFRKADVELFKLKETIF